MTRAFMKCVLIASSALLVGILSAGSAVAAPANVFVGKTNCSAAGPGTSAHPYCTIQEGVDAATAGQTIQVNPGTYTESVVVNKTVNLQGNKATVTAAGPDGMELRADNILVIGFTFSGKSDGPAIYTDGTYSGYTIRNNTITNNVFGIYLNSNGTHVTNVLFNHITGNNVCPDPNTCSASGNGIYSDQGLHNVFVSQNSIDHQDNAGMGVFVGAPSDKIRFDRNLVQTDAGGAGLILAAVSNSTVTNNTLRNLGGNGVMLVQGGSNNTVSGNVMTKDFRGLRIGHPVYGSGIQTNLLVQNNTITSSFDSDAAGGTNAGLYVSPDSMQNSTVFKNTSSNNVGDGILVDTGMNTGNSFSQNIARHNGQTDAEDRTTGTGTAMTANSWDNNHCATSLPPGLCATP